MQTTLDKVRSVNWKLIMMRVIVNGIAIALTVVILPGLKVEDPRFGIFLAMGAVYGLLNAFVRPIIQFLTLSFLFVTFGIVIIFINSVLLLLLGLIFPILVTTSGILGLVAGGALLAFLGLFLESILGLAPPLIDDAETDTAGEAIELPPAV